MSEADGRKRMKNGSRKAQLIRIAAEVFAEDGYTETTIDRISNEAGITGPALYRHFSSKQEILDTICVSGIEQALETARDIQIQENLSAEQKLRKLIKTRIDYLFGPMCAAYLLAVSQKAHLSVFALDRTKAMQKEFRDICGAFLTEIKPDTIDSEIRVAFFAIQSMNIYSAWRFKDRGMLPAEDFKILLEDMSWNMLIG